MLREEAPSEPDLRDYARVVWRRRLTVAASVAVVLIVALGISYAQTPRYAATAKVLLKPRSATLFNTDSAQPIDPARAVQTEIEVIKTEPVQDLVRQKIGSAPPVDVKPVGQTDLITIRGESTVPKRSAEVANAYATSYIEFRRKQNIDELLASSHEIETKINDLQKQIDDLGAQIDAVPPCVDAKSTPTPCSQREGVNQRRTTLLTQQASFRQRLDQLQVDQALASGGAQLVTPASTPAVPFSPTPKKNAVVAVILGLFCGVALALLFEYLDDSVKDKDDFERTVPGVPVIGLIPALSDWKAKDETRLVSLSDPRSPATEAYKILRTSIQFLALDREVRLIQITSPNAQEGKTTTLSNLAVAFARSGLRTIVVCCDLRRPRLHEFFGVTNEVGFTSALMGTVPLKAALQAVPGQERLRVLASGPLPPNPAELLASQRTAELLKTLGSLADILLIDSPPTLPVTDALVLSQQVDATLLVASAGKTTRKAAARASEMLQQVDAPIVGAVLNAVPSHGHYGSYSYRYYSSHQAEPNGTGANGGEVQAAANGAAGVKRPSGQR